MRSSETIPNLGFTGYISDQEKANLFAGASASIFPSLSEGFGIPIVESALIDVPVACSNLPVFREVASDFAWYFDPQDSDSLVRVLREILADSALAATRARELKRYCLSRYSQAATLPILRSLLHDIGIET